MAAINMRSVEPSCRVLGTTFAMHAVFPNVVIYEKTARLVEMKYILFQSIYDQYFGTLKGKVAPVLN
jgi:hypothetical protein